jgi:alpha/beta superfamily hydrolase
MSRAPRAQALTLQGAHGDIEALLDAPVPEVHEVKHFGVICHPHPLQGGTMHNKVVYTLARAFLELSAPTIRFNFRGAGRSAGEHDGGWGEAEDTLAVVSHGRERWPGAALWLAGFSFGGGVALRVARPARAARLITVAPAFRYAVGPALQMPACPWLILQGAEDDVVTPREVASFVARLEQDGAVAGAPAHADLKLLPAAGHFFHGQLPELRHAVLEYLRGSSATTQGHDPA